ncbi:MAG: carotenoid biosynthesis protein [Actinobacteria bacterium]|nr:carotenoid biosynthesis protein [Actinomycetota bacterium]
MGRTTMAQLDWWPSSPTLTVGLVAAAVMALAQAPVPFVDDDRLLTTVVVVAFFAATCALAADVWAPRRVAVAAGVVVAGTLALEFVGHTTGWPFGAYDYTPALVPQIGGVPVVVPLAWWAMAVPAREVAARLAGPGWARVALGAVALTAWDLMLDPQMVESGYWVWEADGPWQGIPLSNYAGWLVSSAVVMVVLDRLLPLPGSSRPLLVLYVWWGISEALAFIVFFGDPLVGVVGGAAMLGLGALAWRGDRHIPRRTTTYGSRG